ncbi:MAG: metal-dependent hydrolase [bacterium]
MPTYKTHLVGGVASFFVMLKITQYIWDKPTPAQIPICLAICLLGSVFPDIDALKSKIQRIFYILVAALLLGALFFENWTLFFLISALALLVTQLKHRTLTHNISFLVSMPGFILLYISFGNQALFYPALIIYLYFIAGAISHVLLDTFVTKINKSFGK